MKTAMQELRDILENCKMFDITDEQKSIFSSIIYQIDIFLLEKEKEQIKITEDTSDGYHTFKELYEFRKVYNAALFNEWAIKEEYLVHKSWKHNDGELCFGGGWFIVVALLPSGQISNHYEAKDWDLFKIPERPTAMFEFDGHTAQDVLNRINQTYKQEIEKL
jgi:hypothetical protein